MFWRIPHPRAFLSRCPIFSSSDADNQPFFDCTTGLVVAQAILEWLFSAGVATYIAIRVTITLALVGCCFVGAELVKQLRLSQHVYPRSLNLFHRLIEVALFGVSPLYANSNQAPCSNVTRAEQQVFVAAAKDIINISKSESTFNRRWMGKFGALPIICCLLWDRINPYETMPDGVHKKHLLWGLYFLKVYDTEENSATNVGRVDEQTYRVWSFRFVEAISYLESSVVRLFKIILALFIAHHVTPLTHSILVKILWSDRFLGDTGNKALVTIDGTDLQVQMKFAENFLSHKFKGNGVKYEVAVCIQTGGVVWIHGPVRCGINDIQVARQAFVSFLNDDEMANADGGYRGEEKHLKAPRLYHYRSEEMMAMAGTARARHETVNGRFKIFAVLTKSFRHELVKHSACFRAVAVVTQLNIENGNPLFQVEYSDEGR